MGTIERELSGFMVPGSAHEHTAGDRVAGPVQRKHKGPPPVFLHSRIRNSFCPISACSRMERKVPAASSPWLGTVMSRRFSSFHRWMWLMLFFTGRKPNRTSVRITSCDDRRGGPDKMIHLDVQIHQFMPWRVHFPEELIMVR